MRTTIKINSMKKTYRFTLPQNKEVESTNIRIENCEVFVDVEFKEKFKPKDGDFLYCEGSGVFIARDSPYKGTLRAYVGINNSGEINTQPEIFPLAPYRCQENNCRFATPEEKNAFLERLEKECHKRWNPETNQLEDIKWRAKNGEGYYTVNGLLDVVSEFAGACPHEDVLYERGNYFRTPESAQKVAEQIKEIFKTSKTE